MPRDVVSLAIGGKAFAHWSDLAITVGLDTVDTIAMTAPFEAERAEFRRVFRPLSFQRIEAELDGAALFTGTMVDVAPNIEPKARTVDVSGYALPGVLGDCSAPASALPLEFNGVGLRTIAERVCEPFGVDVSDQLDDDRPFERVALDPGEQLKRRRGANEDDISQGTPWAFLTELAQQRNAVLSSTSDGKLLIWRAATGAPVAKLEGGRAPLVSVKASFAPQDYFSEITGFAPARRGRAGSSYTCTNDRLAGVVRPHCFTCEDSEDADAPEATRAKLGRMFGAAAAFSVEGLPTWRDPQGELWRPNTIVRLKAPDAMVYDWADLLVRSVTLRQTADAMTADLSLVFPGAFSGEIPEAFPWE